jgi:hypothetical protein
MRIATAARPILAPVLYPLPAQRVGEAVPPAVVRREAPMPVARVYEGEYIPLAAVESDPETYGERILILMGAASATPPTQPGHPSPPPALAAYLEQQAAGRLGTRFDLYV